MSRTRARIALVLLWISIPLLLFGYIFSVLWLAVPGLIFMVGVAVIPNHLCPYCGAFLGKRHFDLGIHWSRPDEGYCRECGSLLKYDDQR